MDTLIKPQDIHSSWSRNDWLNILPELTEGRSYTEMCIII